MRQTLPLLASWTLSQWVRLTIEEAPTGGRARGLLDSRLIELELAPDPADGSRSRPQDVQRADRNSSCTGLADGNVAYGITSFHRWYAIAMGSYAGPMARGCKFPHMLDYLL